MRRHRVWVRIACVCGCLLIPFAAVAQQPPARVYLPNPADEDWSFLKDPTRRTDPWDKIKYIPLGGEDSHLTLNGEIRYRPEGLRLRGVGERPTDTDSYLLQRYLFGANAQLGRRLRIYADVQSGIINGRIGSPRPRDQNSLDLHQAFVELKSPIGGYAFSTRIGRQELSIGSTRLISASPGLNVKRSFDGATVTLRRGGWTTAAAVAQLVPVKAGVFDDAPTREQLFWGVATGRPSPRFNRGELGVYYLGIDRRLSQYAQGIGPETRHTIGIKWSVDTTRFDWNYDGLYQFGSFNDGPTRAWAFATETGFRFPATKWRPRLSVRTDVASGDNDAADPRLQAFNPLFPGNSYSGAIGLLGPTNLTDLTGTATFRPRSNLILSFETPSYWRTSTGDGVYSTNQQLLIPPGAGASRYVGSNPGIVAVYQATRHVQLQGVLTRFLPGGFLKQTFVSKGFGFYSASVVYRF